jgi:hypothetical protein
LFEAENNIKIQRTTGLGTTHVKCESKCDTSNYMCSCYSTRSFQKNLDVQGKHPSTDAEMQNTAILGKSLFV